MDDKDASLSRPVVSNVQEMDVVLSKCHDGVIIFGKIRFLDEIPRESCRLGCFYFAHIEAIYRSLGKGIWRRVRRSGNVERDYIQKTFVS